jgi:broad specificity phosphatase PhoE
VISEQYEGHGAPVKQICFHGNMPGALWSGHQGQPLNAVGKQQAEKTGGYFIDKGIQSIFSSLSHGHSKRQTIAASDIELPYLKEDG